MRRLGERKPEVRLGGACATRARAPTSNPLRAQICGAQARACDDRRSAFGALTAPSSNPHGTRCLRSSAWPWPWPWAMLARAPSPTISTYTRSKRSSGLQSVLGSPTGSGTVTCGGVTARGAKGSRTTGDCYRRHRVTRDASTSPPPSWCRGVSATRRLTLLRTSASPVEVWIATGSDERSVAKAIAFRKLDGRRKMSCPGRLTRP